MTVDDSIRYFEDQFQNQNKIIDSLPVEFPLDEKDNLVKKAVHFANAVFALRSMYDSENEKPIEWNRIKDYKGLPVYIKEKQLYSDEWFGWWDIVDTVNGNTVITAYSESFLKKDKGTKWEIYFKKIQ